MQMSIFMARTKMVITSAIISIRHIDQNQIKEKNLNKNSNMLANKKLRLSKV